LKKKIFCLLIAFSLISTSFAAVYALEIGPYSIDLGIIDRILGIKVFSPEEQNINKEPAFKGNEFCRECHNSEYTQWTSSRHNLGARAVDCETCHGPDRTENVDMSRDNCESCHADIPFRPNMLVKVDMDGHYPGVECAKCHNPHSPWPPKAVIAGGD